MRPGLVFFWGDNYSKRNLVFSGLEVEISNKSGGTPSPVLISNINTLVGHRTVLKWGLHHCCLLLKQMQRSSFLGRESSICVATNKTSWVATSCNLHPFSLVKSSLLLLLKSACMHHGLQYFDKLS